MKTYCMSCGSGVEYAISEPEDCPSCYGKIKIAPKKTTSSALPAKKTKTQIEGDELEAFLKKKKKVENRRYEEDDFDEEDEDEENDDLDEDDPDHDDMEDDDDDFEEDVRPRKRGHRARANDIGIKIYSNPIVKETIGNLQGTEKPAVPSPTDKKPLSKAEIEKNKKRIAKEFSNITLRKTPPKE